MSTHPCNLAHHCSRVCDNRVTSLKDIPCGNEKLCLHPFSGFFFFYLTSPFLQDWECGLLGVLLCPSTKMKCWRTQRDCVEGERDYINLVKLNSLEKGFRDEKGDAILKIMKRLNIGMLWPTPEAHTSNDHGTVSVHRSSKHTHNRHTCYNVCIMFQVAS